ncbi:MAG: heavy-metal-associated domain-containing protein [Clostridia bacterium]|nr:heavy-metal-associated domain-containing protein [Clostridia bacterium]
MEKITIKIEGMKCGMCEAHVCDLIRRSILSAKKVKASRVRNEATFLSEKEINKEALIKAITDMGYTVGGISTEPYKKRFLFGK